MEDKVKRIEDLIDQVHYEYDLAKVNGAPNEKLYGIIIGLEVALDILNER